MIAQYARFSDATNDPNWPNYKGVVDPQWKTVQMGSGGFQEAIRGAVHTLDPGMYLIVTPGTVMLAMIFTVHDDGTWSPGAMESIPASIPRLTSWPPKVRR